MANTEKLMEYLDELTSWDVIDKLKTLFKEAIPNDIVIYILDDAEYRVEQKVAYSVPVQIFNDHVDLPEMVLGTRFKIEDGWIYCIESTNGDYDDLEECYWGVDFNPGNWDAIEAIVRAYEAGWYYGVDDEPFEFRSREEADEDPDPDEEE